MVDSKHFSTSTVTREMRQREVVVKAKRVPKLLLVQSQSVFCLKEILADWEKNESIQRAIIKQTSGVSFESQR